MSRYLNVVAQRGEVKLVLAAERQKMMAAGNMGYF